ncbi:hypothetical protein HBI04_179120 [Parastagonospora nodorum]|nr:hypothetical protein HBH49_201490 [Parastagonospora nodorum]KAH4254398.1 hypothetical protein HBI03_184780 [Parastagonospora nodorum]KAH4266054.1 hypothetical protein HBI04_179120 [Parastagonospora nodorum]KAH5534845.1 hypothetical protein HBI27_183060 [Parastagonospora nodorum]KAH5806750.1 hypothetical protein HBI94_171860 [Parastagonospora nodorum]
MMVDEAHDLSNHECVDAKWNFTGRHVQIAVFNDFADSMNADWDNYQEESDTPPLYRGTDEPIETEE